MQITVVFYRSSGWPAWVNRVFSRRKGQKFADVPAHVGILSQGYVYEAVASGVRARFAQWRGEGDFFAQIELPDGAAAVGFLRGQVGRRYDWLAILFDIFGRVLPVSCSLIDKQPDRWDCSRLVEAALIAGGMRDAPNRVPVSPNDLWIELRKGSIKYGIKS